MTSTTPRQLRSLHPAWRITVSWVNGKLQYYIKILLILVLKLISDYHL